MRVRRRYFRRDHALFDVLSDLTHPFLDGDLPAFPDELAYRDHASDPHTAHQHHEHAADVRQSQLVRRRAALRDIVLLAEQRFLVFFFLFFSHFSVSYQKFIEFFLIDGVSVEFRKEKMGKERRGDESLVVVREREKIPIFKNNRAL